jgi:hypothetical protein
MKRLSWFVFFSIFTFSCLDQPDCYQLNNNVIGLGFKIIGGSTDYFKLSNVYTEGFGEGVWDTVGTANTGIYLNPYEEDMNFAIEGYFGPVGQLGIPETKRISLSYKSLVQFVSEDCGERHVFSDLKVISTDFDEIRILNAVPTNPATVNLEIARCPETDILYIDLINDPAVKSIEITPDIVINIAQESTSFAFLPLNLQDTTTTYTFTYADAPPSTFTVNYKTRSKKLSDTCGEQIFVGQLKYDSLRSNFSKVTALADSIHDLPRINFELTR